MLSPISFKYLEDEVVRLKGLTKEDYSGKELSNIVAAQEVHSSLTLGEMAIGMFMNALKGFSFLHEAFKDGKGKVSEITKLKVEREVKGQMVPLDIKFNGKHFNSMVDATKSGQTAGYRFDSLGNAALDNLKKLILPYLNLGVETIKSYSILVMHGVETETINNFISQPILKHYTKYGYYKSNNIAKRIESVLSIAEKEEDIDITDERMTDILQRYNVEDISNILNKKSNDITDAERLFLQFQLKVYQQYDTLEYLGKRLSDMAKMTNVIRTIPNTIAEMEDIISFVKGMTGHSGSDRRKSETSENYIKRTIGTPNDDRSSFPYYVNNFFSSNPHVFESIKTLHWIIDKTNKEFVTYSDQFRRVATKIYSEIGLKLDKTKDLTEKKIRDEFVKFIMSSLVDRADIRPIKWRTKNRQLVTLNGIPAFNERFCQMVDAAKAHDRNRKVKEKGYEGNPFLQSLNVIKDAKTRMNKIVFHGPSRMEISDLNLFRESFEQLNTIDVEAVGDTFKGKVIPVTQEYTNFQRMFVTYAMINYGMHFGLRNYSTILPGTIYKNVSDQLIMKFNDIKNYDKKEFDNIIEAFEIQMVMNYPDSLWYDKVDVDAKVNGEKKVLEKGKEKVYKIYEGKDQLGNYYDRYYEVDGEITWPKYHVEKFGDKVTVYRIQNVEYRDGKYKGRAAFYVKVGMKNRNSIYDLHSLEQAKDYNVNDAFNTKVHHINGFVSPTNIYESEFHTFKEGDVLSISGFSDPGKMYPVGYRVKKVVGKTVQLEPTALPRSKAYYDKPNGLVQDLYNKLEKELLSNRKVFHGFKGRIIVNKSTLPQARPLYQKINNDRFGGLHVLYERQTGFGVEVFINGEVLSQWAYGRQLEIFSKGYEGDKVFNKKEIIETIISQYDDEGKEIMQAQLTRISKEEFNKLVRQAGFNSIGNHWVLSSVNTVEYIEKRIINEINEVTRSTDFIGLRNMTEVIDNNVEDAINELKTTYDNKSVSQLLDDIESRSTSEFQKLIIRWMRPLLLKLNPQYAGGDYNLKTKYAQFTEVGVMELDYGRLARNNKDIVATDRIILHELMHGLTIIQFVKDSKFKTELERRIQLLLVANPALKTRFSQAFKDSEEFMSELFSNEELYDVLNDYKFPDTKKSIIREVYDWIMSWFGKSTDIRTGEQLIKFIKQGIKPMQYNTIEDVIKRDQDMQSRGYDSPELEKIADQGTRFQVAKDEKGNELDWYVGPDGKVMRRVTDKKKGFFSLFTKKGDNRTSGEKKADREWSFTDKTVPKIVDKKEETYDEYKERMDKASIELFVRGRIIHAIDRRVVDRIQNNGANESAINSELMRLGYQDVEITDSLDKKYTIKISIDPSTFDWYEKNIETIYKNHGINVFDDIPSDLKDVLISEVTVGLEELGFAGTIDKLIRHSTGRYSIKDMATGVSFDEATTYRMLSYGDQSRQLMDSARDLKKLQMMIYAIMLKANNPGMQFDDLSVMWIPNSYNATSYDGSRRVEVDDFMRMVETFFKDKKALKEAGIREDIHEVLTKKDPEIFNPSEYSNEFVEEREGLKGAEKSINDNLITKLQLTNETPATTAERLINELTKIIGTAPVITRLGKSNFDGLSYNDQIKAKRLTHQILQLLQDPSTSLAINPELDVSFVTRWIGNYSAMPLPQVQIWKKFRDTQAMKASVTHQHMMNGFQSVHRKVLDDFYREHPVLSKKYLNNANYKALYGFAYKEFDNNGTTQQRLITKNDNEFAKLTVNQQNLLNFMNDIYGSYFKGKDAYVNQKAITITEFGVTKDITVLDMFNRGIEESHKFRFYDGWFPKIQKEQSEMIFEAGKGSYIAGLLNKDFWKADMHNSMTYYQENKFEGRTHNLMVLPLKYMGSVGIDSRRDYSYNLEYQFDRFTKSIEYKKYMDPVYGLGESIRGVLEMTKVDGQPIYSNTAEMLNDKLTSDVLGRTVRQQYTRKPLKFFGSQWEDREIRVDSLLTLSRSWVSATTMWLKPFTGGGNGINAMMLQHKDSLKGTIANKLFGIKEDAIDYTLADSLYADGVYFGEHVVNAMMGKIYQDKTWLLLKKLDYLPDNFDFKSAERFLLSTRNRVISQSSMYVFHRVPEEMVSMVTMIAQLKHLKHPTLKDSNGKPLSIWDCYKVDKDVNGEWDVVWTGGSRGKLKTGKGEFATYTDINEITPQESAKLKRVYERIQGGYRKEEAAALETYVLGKTFIQLKKYAPQLILNAFKSKQNEMDLGYLKATTERRDGETVYEWIGRINEAKFRVLGKFMLSAIMFNSGNRDYKWNNMTDEMKQHVIDAGITLGIWMTAYVGYLKMFGDDKDTDTMKKWWKMYLMDNFIQQYSPNELLKITSQGLQPVALTRALKTVGATTTMMAATWGLAVDNQELAFTQDGDFRGWNEFRKSIPLMASYSDLAKRLSNLDEKYILSETFSKWR